MEKLNEKTLLNVRAIHSEIQRLQGQLKLIVDALGVDATKYQINLSNGGWEEIKNGN